jgi:hypothetical protein
MPGAPLLRRTCSSARLILLLSPYTIDSVDGPAAAGRSRQAFAAPISVSWAAVLLPGGYVCFPGEIVTVVNTVTSRAAKSLDHSVSGNCDEVATTDNLNQMP